MNEDKELPILGNIINGSNEPFAEIYLMEFEEWYSVE
jgi:hypothetical protein